jgi:hypothetical protein
VTGTASPDAPLVAEGVRVERGDFRVDDLDSPCRAGR